MYFSFWFICFAVAGNSACSIFCSLLAMFPLVFVSHLFISLLSLLRRACPRLPRAVACNSATCGVLLGTGGVPGFRALFLRRIECAVVLAGHVLALF